MIADISDAMFCVEAGITVRTEDDACAFTVGVLNPACPASEATMPPIPAIVEVVSNGCVCSLPTVLGELASSVVEAAETVINSTVVVDGVTTTIL